MTLDDGSLFLGKLSLFEQDVVRDGHLADTMQQGAAPDVDDIRFGDVQRMGDADRDLDDAAGVALCFLVV